jgi:HEPN domain-containing protein
MTGDAGLIRLFEYLEKERAASGELVIAARMASRAKLVAQFLSSSQQALEKYLKCILLKRVRATRPTHDLATLLTKLDDSGPFTGDRKPGTRNFMRRLDQYGQYSRGILRSLT